MENFNGGYMIVEFSDHELAEKIGKLLLLFFRPNEQ